MAIHSLLSESERALAHYYERRAFVLQRLERPIPPDVEWLERAHLARLEQFICTTEAWIGWLESRRLGASSA